MPIPAVFEMKPSSCSFDMFSSGFGGPFSPPFSYRVLFSTHQGDHFFLPFFERLFLFLFFGAGCPLFSPASQPM